MQRMKPPGYPDHRIASAEIWVVFHTAQVVTLEVWVGRYNSRLTMDRATTPEIARATTMQEIRKLVRRVIAEDQYQMRDQRQQTAGQSYWDDSQSYWRKADGDD